MATTKEMPRYEWHKKTSALKIGKITPLDNGGAVIVPEDEDYSPFQVDIRYVEMYEPQVGGYYVVCENGHRTFTPGDVFERFYTKIEHLPFKNEDLKTELSHGVTG